MQGAELVFPAQRGRDAVRHDPERHHAPYARGPGYLDRVSKSPAVPHGLRSTFRDWVADRTRYPGEMAEVALAHRISNATEAAYRRGDMIEKRRAMMGDWVAFIDGKLSAENVVKLK